VHLSHYVPCPKILGPRSLSPYLANFQPRALSHSVVTLETTALLPPPAFLDPGLRALHYLVLGAGARRRFDLDLGACHRHPLPQAFGHCRTAIIDLDSASLGAHRRCCPRPRPLSVSSPNLFVTICVKFVSICANLNVKELS
jgi:hypothetical protein